MNNQKQRCCFIVFQVHIIVSTVQIPNKEKKKCALVILIVCGSLSIFDVILYYSLAWNVQGNTACRRKRKKKTRMSSGGTIVERDKTILYIYVHV